jgi:hypothetical protein
MQEEILSLVLFIDIKKRLISLEESVAGKQVDGLGVVELQFFFNDHDQFEDCESFEDENSINLMYDGTCCFRIT